MKAIRCVNHAARVLEVPDPRGDGVRVRIASAGICGSDLHLVQHWELRATLGHEFAGWLDDGTAVAVEPLDPCWECSPCLGGDYHRCIRGVASIIGVGRDGGMAESCLVPRSALVALPTGLEVRDACLVEPLAVAVHGVRRGDIGLGQRIAVVGAGSIGLCAVAAARAAGAQVDVIARHDAQRLAAQRLGASVIDEHAEPGYEVVIDAAGSSASMTQCVGLARPGARVLMLASYWAGLEIPAQELCRKEISLVPAMQYNRCGATRDIDVAARLMAADPEIATALISHRFPLDAAAEAFAVAGDRASGAIKVVLEP